MKRVISLMVLVACSKPADRPAASADPAPPAKHEDRHDPATAAPPLKLEVRIDGTAATWQQDVFDRTAHFTSANNDGEARDTWSLRELAHGVVGPSARVIAVVGDSRQTIETADWNDPARTPIVHRTRRGTLKFRWADKDGKWGETAVKEVVALEITR